MAMIYELCASSESGIFAIPYLDGRRRKAVRLPDGAIVEEPLPNHLNQIPGPADEAFGVGAGGVSATIHHENLGLVVDYLMLTGLYLLPSGEVAAVYGAVAVPIDAGVGTST